MSSPTTLTRIRNTSLFWGAWVPIMLTVVILTADWAEGPKTAFVGVLAVVPMLSAVFASVRVTALVAIVAWLAALAFGLLSSDGNVPAQYIRLFIIALVGIAAVGAAAMRARLQRELMNAQVAAAEAETAKRDANYDWLTSLLNRRGLDAEFVRRQQAAQTGVIVMLDLDDMKQVNDEHGHAVGDEVIAAVAERIRSCTQEADAVARWGGDEFVVVADATPDQGRAIADRIEGRVTGSPIATSVGPLQARVTSGVAEFSDGGTIDEALRRADTDMYGRKRQIQS